MKTNVITQVILAIAVAILFVLHFTSGKTPSTQSNTTVQESISLEGPKSGSIVYIDIDTVLAEYQYSIDLRAKLEETAKTSEAKLNAEQNSYRKNLEKFQYDYERQLMTRSEAAEKQQKLLQEEQGLMQLNQQLQIKIAEEEQVAQRKIINSIMEFLKNSPDFNKSQYVLGTQFGSNVFYSNYQLNVTRKVIAGLNAEYEKNKE